MGAMMLPPAIREALDKRRRAFLWAAADKVSGAQCLVAWENVCRPKEEDGLGMLKLLHRLHHPEGSAWATWVRTQIHLDTLQGDLGGTHWSTLRDLLPAYQRITRVSVGNGRDTAFWEDVWLGDTPLQISFPALYSHFDGHGSSVQEVLPAPLGQQFQRRMSTQAREELQVLQDVSLTVDTDDRSCFFADSNQRLISGMIYRASMKGDETCPAYQFVWKNFALPRVRFFGWLITKNRIQCKSNLMRKRVLQEDICAICSTEHETADHIISGCHFAKEFWQRIGWQPENIAEVQSLWETTAPVPMPRTAFSSLILLICWELWKHRHDVVFRGMPPDHSRLIAACRSSAVQWRCRLPRNDTRLSTFWCNNLPI
jgi:hypothetical protein